MPIFRFLILILLQPLLALLAPCLQAADEQPLPVSVYYSKEDKAWPETEKSIDAVVKKYPRLQVKKISIDTPEGYKALLADEDRTLVKCNGDTTLVMGNIVITSKGQRRDIETQFEPMLDRLMSPQAGKGRLGADVAAFAHTVFGAEAQLEMLPATFGENGENTIYFKVKIDKKQIGWAADVYRPIACPVCNDVQFTIALDKNLKVLDLKTVRGLERSGTPLSEKETNAFRDQFKGRTLKENIKVDGISGATKTSYTYENAASEIVKDLKNKADDK